MDVTAVSIKADVERVVCLPNILQIAFPALDEINNMTHFVDRCCFYVVGATGVIVLTKISLVKMCLSRMSPISHSQPHHLSKSFSTSLSWVKASQPKTLRDLLVSAELKSLDNGAVGAVV